MPIIALLAILGAALVIAVLVYLFYVKPGPKQD
jgi:hypothetical protein